MKIRQLKSLFLYCLIFSMSTGFSSEKDQIEYRFNKGTVYSYSMSFGGEGFKTNCALDINCVGVSEIANHKQFNLLLDFKNFKVSSSDEKSQSRFNEILKGMGGIEFDLSIDDHGKISSTNIKTSMDHIKVDTNVREGTLAVISPMIQMAFECIIPEIEPWDRNTIYLRVPNWNALGVSNFPKLISGEQIQALNVIPFPNAVKHPEYKDKIVLWKGVVYQTHSTEFGDDSNSFVKIARKELYDKKLGVFSYVKDDAVAWAEHEPESDSLKTFYVCTLKQP